MNLRPGLRRVLRVVLLLMAIIAIAVVARSYFAFRDRLPGHSLALSINSQASDATPRALQVGFGRIKINPDLSNPKRPVWLAGFSQNRAATAIHDDLWAVACVVDDGYNRVGVVALDAIGFFNDDVVRVRKKLPADLRLAYTIVTSTHNHSTPDLMGLWGPSYFRTGVNEGYRRLVIDACVSSLTSAVSNLAPAQVAFHELPLSPTNLVEDTRPPQAFDCDLRLMHFTRAGTRETIGTIVTWGNHPETVWGKNTEVTSDFCGYLRDGLEKGVEVQGQVAAKGLGGIHMYINGAVGGLMSTTPKTVVKDPFTGETFLQPSHEKARAVGHQLVARALTAINAANDGQFSSHMPIALEAKTILMPLSNKGYLLAGFLGLIDRGYVRWKTLRTEVALMRFGPASIACVPGEIYPELVNGGVETPAGADFPDAPVPTPLRQAMPGSPKFVFGLANDEIGYILPKSQWDDRPPFAYGSRKGHYGEINSVGPEAGPVVISALSELCRAADVSAQRQAAAPLPQVETKDRVASGATPRAGLQ